MLTLKLKITDCSDFNLLDEYIYEYTGLFHKLYNNMELMADEDFIKDRLNDYIDKSIYDMCIIDVKMKYNQYETDQNKKLKQIEQINGILNEKVNTKKEKYRNGKLFKKLNRLKKSINKNVCFGGKQLLRDITRLKQNNSNPELLNKKLIEYKKNRKLPIYLVGRSSENGNRKVKFDLKNQKIIFKPNRHNHIEISFKDNRRKILHTLQEMSDNKMIPLTVSISSEYVYISYDEELVNGFSFNNIECKKEQKNKSKEERKEIYIKYKQEQYKRKLIDKIEYRYCSIDLNPKKIGLSITDYINGEQKIIYTELIDLTKLSLNKVNSTYRNNKRKHEIKEVYKHIFNLVRHYRCFNFVIEDLNFNNDNKDFNKETNRQIRNIWNRELQTQLINKYCNEIGLNLIEVNPCYSSFIGNMIYNFTDPISASLEIGRRGSVKYLKGSSIYPDISRINQEKLAYLLGENIDLEGTTWVKLYNRISLLRYRNPETGLIGNNLRSNNSLVKILKNV